MLGLLWESLSICSALQSWSCPPNLDYANETHSEGSALLSQPPLQLAWQHLSPVLTQPSEAPSFKAWLPAVAYSHSSQTSAHISLLPTEGPTDSHGTGRLRAKTSLFKRALHDLAPRLSPHPVSYLSIASPSSHSTCSFHCWKHFAQRVTAHSLSSEVFLERPT